MIMVGHLSPRILLANAISAGNKVILLAFILFYFNLKISRPIKSLS